MRGAFFSRRAARGLAVTCPSPAPAQYRIGMRAAITGPASPPGTRPRTRPTSLLQAGERRGRDQRSSGRDHVRGRPRRAAARGGGGQEVRRRLDPDDQRVHLRHLQAVHDGGGDEKIPLLFGGGVCPREAFPPRTRSSSARRPSARSGTAASRSASSRSRRAGKKVKVGFAAQDIPLSRIELEFAEQLAKEMGFETVPVVVVPGNTSDFTPFAQKLKDEGVDWVLLVGAVARGDRSLRGAAAHRLARELSPLRPPADAGRAGAAEGAEPLRVGRQHALHGEPAHPRGDRRPREGPDDPPGALHGGGLGVGDGAGGGAAEVRLAVPKEKLATALAP